MKIICDSADLAKAAFSVQRTVSGKSTIPSLEGILIEAFENKIKLTGYDLEVGSTVIIDGDVRTEGKIVLNAKNFCDILRMVPDDTISIETDDRNIAKIKSGEADYSIIATNAEDYPELPTLSKFSPVVVELGLLKDMIKKTIFSVSTGERNPVHNGVKFEISQNKIVLVAVDGARLAVRREEINYDEDQNGVLNFVVPAKTLGEIQKNTSDDDTPVEIKVGDRHIIFSIGEYKVISRLLEGNFLNYKSAIPISSETTIIVETKRLIESIERTSLIITDKSSPLRLIVENNVLKFSSVTALGTASDRMAADIEGKNIEIGFNNRFVLDCLKVCDVEKIKIEMISANQPITFSPLEGDHFFFLILPVRI
ncbi:MAG: DNA polymerase III subunit beta [Clostridia bacterium]|nr:DNA polymerase III subunit beta [Clostridia bacterium]